MLTYNDARELVETYAYRQDWKNPRLPLGGGERSATIAEYGNYYACDETTGKRRNTGVHDDFIVPFPKSILTGKVFDKQSIDIVYHGTAVVTIHPDNSYTLRTGGWYSVSTRKRIEMVAPIQISGPLRRAMGDLGRPAMSTNPCEGGPWLVRSPDGSVCEFSEGIDIDAQGRVIDHTN